MGDDRAVLPRLVPPTSLGASRDVIRHSLLSLDAHLGLEVSCCGLREPGDAWVHCVDQHGQVSVRLVTDAPATVGGMLLLDRRTDGDVDPGPAPAPPAGLEEVSLVRVDGHRLGRLYLREAAAGDLSESDLAVLRMFAELIASHLGLLVDYERRRERTRGRVGALMADDGPTMALQPIVEVDGGAVHSYEALARFGDVTPPEEWFHAAAAVDLGPDLEFAAVLSALRLLPRLPAGVRLSVNVSAESLARGEMMAVFTGEHAPRLIAELTEHTRVAAHPDLDDRMRALRKAGTLLAVDDAGSGYAGLEHILELQPDIVKLDRALVHGIADHAGRQAVVEAMVGFVDRVGARLVAEGVETEEDLARLRELGVGLVQGYLVGQPAIGLPA